MSKRKLGQDAPQTIVIDGISHNWNGKGNFAVANKNTGRVYYTSLNLCIGDKCVVEDQNVVRVQSPSTRMQNKTYANFVSNVYENQLFPIFSIRPGSNGKSKILSLNPREGPSFNAIADVNKIKGIGLHSVATVRKSPTSGRYRVHQTHNPHRNNTRMPPESPGVPRTRIVTPKGLVSNKVQFVPYRQPVPKQMGCIHGKESTIKVAVGQNITTNKPVKYNLNTNLRPFIHIIQDPCCTYHKVLKAGQSQYGQTVYTEGIIFAHTDERWDFGDDVQARPRFVIYIPDSMVKSVTIPDPVYMATMSQQINGLHSAYGGNDLSMQVRLHPFQGVVLDVQRFAKRLTIHVLWTSRNDAANSRSLQWTCI